MRLKLLGIGSLAALILVAGLYSGSAPVSALTNCTVDASIDSEEQAFLTIINQYRAQNHLGALKLSSTLNQSAAWKSQDMAFNGYVAHDDTPINRTWIQRIRDCGYGYNAWIGENIAVGNSSASATFEQWRGSPPHNDNMLGQYYTTIGIGRAYNANSQYKWYWTTEFGSYSDGYTPADPSPTPTPTSTTPPSETPAPPPASTPCTDVTNDGHVNMQDILYVVNHYRTNDPIADLDGSGMVGVQDIVLVVADYGQTC